MKGIFILLAFWAFSAHVYAQIALPKAANVSVSAKSVLAVYPEIEFVLDQVHGKLHVCRTEPDGTPLIISFDAKIRLKENMSAWTATTSNGLVVTVNAQNGDSQVVYGNHTKTYSKTLL